MDLALRLEARCLALGLVVPLLYAGMLTTSMIAQLYASVGLQVVIRNLGPLVTLPIERVFNEPIVADVHQASLVFILSHHPLHVAVAPLAAVTRAGGRRDPDAPQPGGRNVRAPLPAQAYRRRARRRLQDRHAPPQ